MNLNIIYEPYIFSFIVATLISIIYYCNEKNKIDDEDEIQKDNNLMAKTIVTLLISYIIIMIIYYSYRYLSFEFSTASLMAGGSKVLSSNKQDISEINTDEVVRKREKIMERLTVVDDDVDVSILED